MCFFRLRVIDLEKNNEDVLKKVENKYTQEIQALKDEIVRLEEVKQQFESVKEENQLLKSGMDENNDLKYVLCLNLYEEFRF